jgi:hypothetical protein
MDMTRFVRKATEAEVGTTTLSVVAAINVVGLDATCLRCRDRFRVSAVAAVMRVGQETLGYFCPACVRPEIRERMLA